MIIPLFQVASELNAAILRAEHAESTQSKLAVMLKRLLWAQEELDKKRVWPPSEQRPTGRRKAAHLARQAKPQHHKFPEIRGA